MSVWAGLSKKIKYPIGPKRWAISDLPPLVPVFWPETEIPRGSISVKSPFHKGRFRGIHGAIKPALPARKMGSRGYLLSPCQGGYRGFYQSRAFQVTGVSSRSFGMGRRKHRTPRRSNFEITWKIMIPNPKLF